MFLCLFSVLKYIASLFLILSLLQINCWGGGRSPPLILPTHRMNYTPVSDARQKARTFKTEVDHSV